MTSTDKEQGNAAKPFDLKILSDLLEAHKAAEAKAFLHDYLNFPNPKRDLLFHAAELFLKHRLLGSAETAYQASPSAVSLGNLLVFRGNEPAQPTNFPTTGPEQ